MKLIDGEYSYSLCGKNSNGRDIFDDDLPTFSLLKGDILLGWVLKDPKIDWVFMPALQPEGALLYIPETLKFISDMVSNAPEKYKEIRELAKAEGKENEWA